MTEPRRVRSQAERDADGQAWRAVADTRPGYATWPHTQPGDPSWWRRDLIGVLTSDGRIHAPEDVQLVYPTCSHEWHGADGGKCPGCGWDSHPIPLAPRRRWWHRLTRRNP